MPSSSEAGESELLLYSSGSLDRQRNAEYPLPAVSLGGAEASLEQR